MNIRKATAKDFESLYQIGLDTPELKVSSGEDFMAKDEFLQALESQDGTFLLAEDDDNPVGFIYAHRKDKPNMEKKWACIVYLVIKPEYRKQGIAQKLYDACLEELKQFGINCVYTWASSESDGGIINFMKKNGFNKGHQYTWMDREI